MAKYLYNNILVCSRYEKYEKMSINNIIFIDLKPATKYIYINYLNQCTYYHFKFVKYILN